MVFEEANLLEMRKRALLLSCILLVVGRNMWVGAEETVSPLNIV
jgi:hypothetical protein